jgi:hypothetical protein
MIPFGGESISIFPSLKGGKLFFKATSAELFLPIGKMA